MLIRSLVKLIFACTVCSSFYLQADNSTPIHSHSTQRYVLFEKKTHMTNPDLYLLDTQTGAVWRCVGQNTFVPTSFEKEGGGTSCFPIYGQ
jgi:hypothetical protein